MSDTFEQELARGLNRLAERAVPQVAPRLAVADPPGTVAGADGADGADPAIVSTTPEPVSWTTKRWWQAAAALVVVAAATGLLLLRSGPEITHQSVGVADDWRDLASAPLTPREHHTAVWTGSEMIIWGGESIGPADCGEEGADACAVSSATTEDGRAPDDQLADGAAYDPATDTWRMLPPAPVQPRSHHAAVWTGTEMIIWGGSNGYRPDQLGAAYNPGTDTWRVLPETPATQILDAVLLWDGEILHAFGDVMDNDGGVHHLRYDPATNAWSDPAPIGLDRAETGLVAADGTLYVAGRGDDPLLRSAVRSTDGVTWSTSPGYPEPIAASGPQLMVEGDRPGEFVRIASVATVDAVRGVAIMGFAGTSTFISYPVEGDEPRVPSTTGDTVSDNFFAERIHDGRVLTTNRWGEASVGVIGGRWVHLPEHGLSAYASSHVWTGEELIVWGGRSRSNQSIADGAAIAIAPLPADDPE